MLNKRLEDAKAIGLAAARLYTNALSQFGGVTSLLPLDPSAYSVFSWMKSNFAKLLDFMGGAIDFGALSTAMNFSKMLTQSGYTHIEGLKEKKDIKDLAELGETSRGLLRSVRNFMKSLWVKFGRADAPSMAEAQHAAVSPFPLANFGL
jgi:hypothetical protein